MRYLIILLFLFSCSPSKKDLIESCADNKYYNYVQKLPNRNIMKTVTDLQHAASLYDTQMPLDYKYNKISVYEKFFKNCELDEKKSPIDFNMKFKNKKKEMLKIYKGFLAKLTEKELNYLYDYQKGLQK